MCCNKFLNLGSNVVLVSLEKWLAAFMYMCRCAGRPPHPEMDTIWGHLRANGSVVQVDVRMDACWRWMWAWNMNGILEAIGGTNHSCAPGGPLGMIMMIIIQTSIRITLD